MSTKRLAKQYESQILMMYPMSNFVPKVIAVSL